MATNSATQDRSPSTPDATRPGVIMLNLRNVSQLFNSLDPAPFIERDLDPEAEAFIVSWARQFPANCQLSLRVHVAEPPPSGDAEAHIREGVRNYFNYQAGMSGRELRHVLLEGRRALVIGLVFLAACTALASLIGSEGMGFRMAREGLLIGGWVAMWRPLELLLYDWWPIRRSRKLFERLAAMPVDVIVAPPVAAFAPK